MSEEQEARIPVDYDQLYPGRFLKAGLFQGKPRTLTVKSVVLEKMPQEKGPDKDKGIVSFTQTEMQLTLNSTNGQCLKAMFGKTIADWVGKRVTFVPEKDRFGKEVVDAIRIKGSPDIEQDIDVEIRMPRKKPKQRRLTVTGKETAASNTSDNLGNSETGEVVQ